MPTSPALPLDLPAHEPGNRSRSVRLSRRPMTSFELTVEEKLMLEELVRRTGASSKREAIVTGLRRYAAAEGIDIRTSPTEARAAR